MQSMRWFACRGRTLNEHKSRWPTEKMKLKDHFLEVLSNEQKFRGYEGIEWIERERKVMFDEVNLQRSKRNKSPVSLPEVVKVETMACGHIDYSSKFALYCAELVLDDSMKGVP